MLKEDFIKEMREFASNRGEVVVDTIRKPGLEYTGLFVRKNGQPTPVVNLDELYEKHENGRYDLTDCCVMVSKILDKEPDVPVNIKMITDWKQVKEKLYLKLVGNVSDGIYVPVEDMALIPYIELGKGAAIRVTPELCNAWGVSQEEVIEVARANQEIIRPVKIAKLSDIMPTNHDAPLYVVSTEDKVVGASAILYNGVVDKLRELIGEDFYILPSSIHEMLVVPKCMYAGPEELKDMVSYINSTTVDDEDKLTDSVYTYDFDTREFKKVI